MKPAVIVLAAIAIGSGYAGVHRAMQPNALAAGTTMLADAFEIGAPARLPTDDDSSTKGPTAPDAGEGPSRAAATLPDAAAGDETQAVEATRGTAAAPRRVAQRQAPPSALAPQTAPAGTPSPEPAAEERPAAEPKVDESALRYFARQGDTKRLQAEIARLKALYPNWTPPADPLAVPAEEDTEIARVWRLYAEGKYAEARKAIADRQEREPSWQPPRDLLDRLAVAEAREKLINASNLKQYETVIRVATSAPSLLTCSEIDMLWRTAEAFARTDRLRRAEDAYTYILKTCTDDKARLATMQKALALLPKQNVESLLTFARTPDGGNSGFDPIRDELARRSLAEGGRNPSHIATPEEIARIEERATAEGKASDALLLGWYDLRHDKLADAERWFRAARAKEDSASAAQGLALVLIDRKAPAEAEDVIYNWRDSSDGARKVYLAAVANLLAQQPTPTIDEKILQRMAEAAAKARDAAAAQQFGWYSRAFGQNRTAEQWFETALAWKPDDEPSAYGLALSRQALGDRSGLAEVQRTWAGRSARIAAVGERRARPVRRSATEEAKPDAKARSETADRSEKPQTSPAVSVSRTASVLAPRGCAGTLDPSTLSAQSALNRGWCLMDLNRPMQAAAAFGAALASGSDKVRQDAAYGQSLAYLRLGLTSKAAIAAAKAPQTPPRRNELQAAILAGRATGAFEAERYVETLMALDQRAAIAAERTDLMVLRGYAYLNLRRYNDARTVFEAVAATGSRDGMRALADLDAATHQGTD